MTPNARQERLLVQELARRRSFTTAARPGASSEPDRSVGWRHCDGQHTVPDLAALLGDASPDSGGADVVWLALGRLEKAHLLQERLVRPVGAPPLTRREMLRKAARVGGLTLLLPVIQSMVAPTPAMAASIGLHQARAHTHSIPALLSWPASSLWPLRRAWRLLNYGFLPR